MSQNEPEKSYIYQPYGSIGHLNPDDREKMYAVVGKGNGTRGELKGLTKEQAQKILEIIT